MKTKLYILLLILTGSFLYSQTTYYSKSTGNLNTLSTWGLNADGSGTSPSNFTTATCTYVVTNTTAATIGANWTVSGTGSKVQVGDGSTAINLTIPSTFALNGTVDVTNTATLTILNTTIPTMGVLAAGSTIEYGSLGNQTIRNADYYNLICNGSGIKTLANTANTSISNDLIINSGLIFRLNTTNTLTCTLTGSVSGTGAIYGGTSSNLNISGSGNLGTLTFTTSLSLYQLTINRTGAITLGSNLTVSNAYTQTNGTLNLGGRLLTLNNIITFPASYSNGSIMGSSTSSITIGGTGTITNGLLMDQTSSATKTLSQFIFNRIGQTLAVGNELIVADRMTHTAGIVSLNNSLLSLNGIISFPSSTSNGVILGSSTSSLSIAGSGNIGNRLYMDQTSPTTRTLHSFSYNRSGVILTLGNNLISSGEFIHNNGTISISTTSLALNGNITFPLTATNGIMTGSATSSLVIGGTGTVNNALYMNQGNTATRTLASFTINRSGQTVPLKNNLIVSVLFTQTSGNLLLETSLLSLNGAITFPNSATDGYIIGSTTASVTISTKDTIVTNSIYMDQTSSATKTLSQLIFNRASQTLVVGNDLIVSGRITHTSGIINLNSSLLTLNGIVTFPTTITSGKYIGSSSASMNISGSGAITNSLFMDQTSSSTKTLNSFTFDRAGINLTLGNDLITANQLTHTNGTLTIGTTSLTLNGAITFPASVSNGMITGSTTSSLSIGGTGTITNALYMRQTSTTTRSLASFSINRTGQTVTLGNSLIVSGSFTQSNGNIGLGSSLLTLNGDITLPSSVSNGVIIGSNTASLTIGGTGTVITNSMYMDQASSTTKTLAQFIFNRTGQTLGIGNDLLVANLMTHTAGIISLNNSMLTLNGVITFPTTVTNGKYVGSSSSSMNISGSGAITNSLFMDQTSSTTKTLNSFTFNRTGINLTLGNDLIAANQLTHTNGTITIGTASLTLNGDITFPASVSNGMITGSTTSSLSIGGTGTITNALYMRQTTTTTRSLASFSLNRIGQTLTLGNDLIIPSSFTQSSGNIGLGNTLLTINGTITFPSSASNGVIIGSSTASLSIGGTGTITNSLYMDQTSSTTKSMHSITLNRTGQTLTLGNDLNLINTLTPTNGIFASAGFLRLVAISSSATARIATIGTGASVTGNVTVETFASGGSTGWTTLGSAGITGRTMADWDDDIVIICASCPDGSTAGGTGFNSILNYNETVGGVQDNPSRYSEITSISNAITVGKGYWVYLGDGQTTTNDISFDVTGPVNQGNYVIGLSYTSTGGGSASDWGYNLIANPYPSPISWTALRNGNTNVADAIYVYNPDIGDYATYVAGVSSPAVVSGGIGNMIPAGQGFYVKASAATSLTARESNKAASTQALLKTNQLQNVNSNPTLIRIKANGFGMQNETAIYFSPNTHSYYESNYDATKLAPTPGVLSIASIINDTAYAINGVEELNQNMSIPIKITTGTTGTYQISADDFQKIPTGACLILHDNVTNTNHNLRTSAYTCTISDTETSTRFSLNITITNDINVTSTNTNPTCKKSNDGYIIANVSNTGMYDYYWKDSTNQIVKTTLGKSTADTLTNLSSGYYSVDVTTSGSCRNGSQTVNLIAQTNLSASFMPSVTTTTLTNDTAIVGFTNNSINADSYLWLFGDGNESTEQHPTNAYTALGEYPVTLLAYNSVCGDTTEYTMNIVITDAQTNIETKNNIQSNITISRDKGGYFVKFNYTEPTTAVISIWGILGQKTTKDIVVKNATDDKVYISLQDINEPLLIINVVSDKGDRTYRKLVNN